jgi:hypothetical protein
MMADDVGTTADAELYEDNAGHLTLVAGRKAWDVSDVTTGDALEDLLIAAHDEAELTAAWTAPQVCVAECGLDHPECRCIAKYSIATGWWLSNRAGANGRRYLATPESTY